MSSGQPKAATAEKKKDQPGQTVPGVKAAKPSDSTEKLKKAAP